MKVKCTHTLSGGGGYLWGHKAPREPARLLAGWPRPDGTFRTASNVNHSNSPASKWLAPVWPARARPAAKAPRIDQI
jgi:hypothetical protein